MSIFSRTPFLAAMFALCATTALIGGPSNGLELSAMQMIAKARSNWPWMTGWVAAITTLGGVRVVLGLTSGTALWLLLRRPPALAILLAITVLAERLLVEGLKDWIGRPRPSIGVDWLPPSLAFPSGHAANSMTGFLATALIAVPSVHRRPAVIAALLLSFLIGLSRVYLGLHWPSDVIGGWALGLLSVGIALAIGERSGALRLKPQHKIVGRHRPARGEDEAP